MLLLLLCSRHGLSRHILLGDLWAQRQHATPPSDHIPLWRRWAFEGRFGPNGPVLRSAQGTGPLAAGVTHAGERTPAANANGQHGIAKNVSYPLRITPAAGDSTRSRRSVLSTLLVPALAWGVIFRSAAAGEGGVRP